MDYWMPPTCSNCHAILDSDGNHWASGKAECSESIHNATDECFDSEGQPLPFGRCDTCGAPCDEAGCTSNRHHEAALA